MRALYNPSDSAFPLPHKETHRSGTPAILAVQRRARTMADPLSITTGIITLWSVISKIKKFKAAYEEAGNLLNTLESECELTLDIIRSTKRGLDRLELITGSYYIDGGVNIRQRLARTIEELRPDLFSLSKEITQLSAEPKTRLSVWTSRGKRLLQSPPGNVAQLQKRIVKKREEFNQLRAALDS
jgi:hypothetical protein